MIVFAYQASRETETCVKPVSRVSSRTRRQTPPVSIARPVQSQIPRKRSIATSVPKTPTNHWRDRLYAKIVSQIVSVAMAAQSNRSVSASWASHGTAIPVSHVWWVITKMSSAMELVAHARRVTPPVLHRAVHCQIVRLVQATPMPTPQKQGQCALDVLPIPTWDGHHSLSTESNHVNATQVTRALLQMDVWHAN